MPIPSVLRLPSSDYKALALVMLLQVMQLNFAETVITSSRSYGSIVFWCFWVIGGRLPALMAAPEADAQPQVPTIEPVAVSIP
jgi:hypothetical protein